MPFCCLFYFRDKEEAENEAEGEYEVDLDEEDEGVKACNIIKLTCSTKRLLFIKEVKLKEVHKEILDKTPFKDFGRLCEMKYLPMCVDVLLRYWVKDKDEYGFRLGGEYVVPFIVQDVEIITRLSNVGRPINLNRPMFSSWAREYFCGE